MIYYVSREDYPSLSKGSSPGSDPQAPLLKSLAMKTFYEGSVRRHYISPTSTVVELRTGIGVSVARPESSRTGSRIFNYPNKVLERYPLLKRCRPKNKPFTVSRYDAGERPQRYPVYSTRRDARVQTLRSSTTTANLTAR